MTRIAQPILFGAQKTLTLKQVQARLKTGQPVTARQILGNTMGISGKVLDQPLNTMTAGAIEGQVLAPLLSLSAYTGIKAQSQLNSPNKTGQVLASYGQSLAKLLLVLGNRVQAEGKAEAVNRAKKPKPGADSPYMTGLRTLLVTGRLPVPPKQPDPARGAYH